MNNRRLSFGLLLTITTLVAACGGEPAKVDTPAQPSATPSAEPAAPMPTDTAAANPTPTPSATPSATADATPPPPAAKPAKDKFVGKFVQDFSGEVKDTWEADAKKKYAKEKDTKKHDDAAKKKADELAQTTIENTADTHTLSVKGKAVHKVHYDVSKGDDPNTLVIKLGKDEVAKKDLKGAEITITFTDDNTFTMKDPAAKDPKKAQTLVFKRQ